MHRVAAGAKRFAAPSERDDLRPVAQRDVDHVEVGVDPDRRVDHDDVWVTCSHEPECRVGRVGDAEDVVAVVGDHRVDHRAEHLVVVADDESQAVHALVYIGRRWIETA